MKQSPDDHVAYSAFHPERGLALFGVSRRKLAKAKVTAMLRANGFTERGWVTGPTCTLLARNDVVKHARRSLATRAAEQLDAFYDNRSGVLRDVTGSLVMYGANRERVERIMSAMRADVDRYLASTAQAA